jgi:predicted glycosyltransferase
VKIWYDACTGKQVRYGAAIAKRLRKSGHEVIFTTREHPDTTALACLIGEKPIVVGKYHPTTLFSRLEASANRIIQFAKLFKNDPPDMAIAHQSVELCRTAFGLGIPIILTADTPHAKAVNKLTIPFAHTLIVSEALPRRFFKDYCPDRVIQFRGVDETAWIRGLKTPKTSDFKKPLIVVREFETRAAYALGTDDFTLEVARKLESLGNVLLLKRYDTAGKSEFVDSVKLVANADLVVSAGGTLSREAALQGVPSIVVSQLGRTHVNKYLADKGFPIFMSSKRNVVSLAKRWLGKRMDVKDKLAQFDDPVEIIENVVTKIQTERKE